jgi:hypothetical protein
MSVVTGNANRDTPLAGIAEYAASLTNYQNVTWEEQGLSPR